MSSATASRVALPKIKALTFYKDSLTAARRTDPVPELTCTGTACSLYTPDVVRCVNVGGEGTEVDWKCEADLPEALRFGRVEVSCEGWSAAGDPFVLKGSCALQYRLVEVPGALRRGEDHKVPRSWTNWFGSYDISAIAFSVLWAAILLFILYQFLKSCFEPRPAGPSRRPTPGGGGGSSYGHRPDDSFHDTPPPYSKYPSSSAAGADPTWRPGFWSGAALGGLGTYLMNNNNRRAPPPGTYDWERVPPRPRPSPFVSGWTSQAAQRAYFGSDDRGEGPSNLGSMRRSTGLGGSSVR